MNKNMVVETQLRLQNLGNKILIVHDSAYQRAFLKATSIERKVKWHGAGNKAKAKDWRIKLKSGCSPTTTSSPSSSPCEAARSLYLAGVSRNPDVEAVMMVAGLGSASAGTHPRLRDGAFKAGDGLGDGRRR